MSRIDPSEIPGADIDLSAVRTGATGLKGNGSTIRDSGADVVRDWQQLPGSFEVTGTAALYSAMVPVGSNTQLIGDSLGMIATALASYAYTVEPIKARLDSLRTQASAFVAKTNSFSSKVEWISSGYTLGIPLPEKVDSWDEDPGLNDENNSLIRDVAAAEADWLDAQQQCANAIRAAVCLAPTGAADEQSLASQLRSGDALQTQWGSTTDRKESCSEKAITFQSHFLWDGVIVGFGWGTVKTLMTLGGTNPDSLWHAGQALLSGDWDGVLAAGQEDRAAMGTAWLGVAHIASAVAIPISPAERMALLNSGAMDWLPDSVKQEAENWTAGDGTALYGTVAGLVGLTLPTKWWDPKAYKADQVFQNWTDNPGGAAGLSVANIGSFFIPGVGEARGAGLAADAAKVADGARLGDLIADGSVASLRGLSADALQSTIRGLSAADAARLASELGKPELDAGALSALQLDDLTLDDLTLHDPADALPVQGDGGPTSGVDPASGPGDAQPPHEVPGGTATPDHGGPTAPDATAPGSAAPSLAASPEQITSYASSDPLHPGEWPPHAVQVGQPGADGGRWVQMASRDNSTSWADYQAQITGVDMPTGRGLLEYRVEGPTRPVDFDGMTMRGQPPEQVFLEAKYGYGSMFDGSQWARLSDIQLSRFAKEATAQLDALPDGASLEWHFSDPAVAERVDQFFRARDLDVVVVATPVR